MEKSILNLSPAEILALSKEDIVSAPADDLVTLVKTLAHMETHIGKARNAIINRMDKLGFADTNQRYFLQRLQWLLVSGCYYDELMTHPVTLPNDHAIIDAYNSYVTISVFPAVDINTVLARYDWRLCGEGTEYRNSANEYGHLIQMDEDKYRFEFSGENFY